MSSNVLSSLMRKAKSKKKGFTLVEILVVILIIGLLFVFLVPKIDSATDKARETGIKTDFRSYQTAFEAVAREHSGFGSVTTADADATGVIKAINGYLDPALQITVDGTDADKGEALKKDPWNNTYKFISSVEKDVNNGGVGIYTLGKNAKADELTAMPTLAATANDVVSTLGMTRVGDNYALVTECIDGQIFTATNGFTTNITAK